MSESNANVFFVLTVGETIPQQFAAIVEAFPSVEVLEGEDHKRLCIVPEALANRFERSVTWLVGDNFTRSSERPAGFTPPAE